MSAHRITPEEMERLIEAHKIAKMRCDPEAEAAPRAPLVRSQADLGRVFVTDDLSASALVRDEQGEIMWFTHLRGDPAQNLAALCDAIRDAFGVDPWGTMRNPETRSAVAQEHLHADPEDPERVTWRRDA